MSDQTSFVRNAWYVAAFASELQAGTLLARRMLDEPVVLLRRADGGVAALDDICPHRYVPLSIGKQLGDAIQCGYHGAVIGADGACRFVPGQHHVPSAMTRTYPALERYGLVWVWMGAAAAADPDAVPDLRWLTHPEWASATGYLHFGCDYRLVTDNLLDLSHESFIHLSTLDNGAHEVIADYPVAVDVDAGRRVFARREMPDVEAPPMFATVMGKPSRIDRLQIASYAPPMVNMTEAGYRPAGTNQPFRLLHRVMHLLTPETPFATHYFFTLSRNFRVDDPTITDIYTKATYETFHEDRAVLELQQQRLRERGEPLLPGMPIVLDAAPVQARRLLAAMVAAESAAPATIVRPPILVKELETAGA